jgi:hypothetical protein
LGIAGFICLLLAAPRPAAADNQVDLTSLPPVLSAGPWFERLACSASRCLWFYSRHMGGCSFSDCSVHAVVLTDRKSKPLCSLDWEQHTGTPAGWFPEGRPAQILAPTELLRDNGVGGEAWDPGLDTTLIEVHELIANKDGSECGLKAPRWHSQQRMLRLHGKIAAGSRRGSLRLQPRPSDALLAKARARCGAAADESEWDRERQGEELVQLDYRCEGGPCLLVMGRESAHRGEDVALCALRIADDRIDALPILELVTGSAAYYRREKGRSCFTSIDGGIRGDNPGDEACLSASDPVRMAFADPAGAQLEWANPYPARRGPSIEEGFAGVPKVHAESAFHVAWGAGAWRGEGDASLRWKALHFEDQIIVRAAVRDDVVVPLDRKRAAVDTDHLELELGQARQRRRGARRGSSQVRSRKPAVDKLTAPAERIKLAALLAPEGRVKVRLWQISSYLEDVEQDTVAPGAGTWKLTKDGYQVELALPLSWVRERIHAAGDLAFSLYASDADEGRQKAIIGTSGVLQLWDEFPPTIDEYLRRR